MTAKIRTLTVGEVAECLRCSRGTVRNMLRRKELKRVKAGRLVRVRESELERYLDRNTR